jgi:nitrogen-specific signal transduction histidine kinase
VCVREAPAEVLLNRIAAIQAAAEILDDNQELSLVDRQAFLTVIQAETARMQSLVRRMAALFPDCMRLEPVAST